MQKEEELHLQNMNLTEIDPELLHEGLITLRCYGNKLTKLPVLPDSLEFLYCNDNCLTVLPNLPSNLVYLDCKNNYLSSLPELPYNLLYLNCCNNQITSLPALNPFIEKAYCCNNLLYDLPDLSGLDNLSTLDCRDNMFQDLHTFNLDGITDTNNKTVVIGNLHMEVTLCYPINF